MGGKAPDEGAASKQAGQFGKELSGQSRNARRMYFAQLENALKTGGRGSNIPVIQRGLANTQTATREALRHAQENLPGRLVQTGDTPVPGKNYFGPTTTADAGRAMLRQQVLGDISRQGSRAATQLPSQLAERFISKAPIAVGNAGQAAGLAAQAGVNARGQALQAAAIKQDAISKAIATLAEATVAAATSPQMKDWVKGLMGGEAPAKPDTVTVPDYGGK